MLQNLWDEPYGLKKRHLQKHKAEVARFFRALEARNYRSELAEAYQKRLLKNERKLFTFLDHDSVPWNNNNAEHAVKAFAYYRRVSDGKMREDGLSDYLVLLSVYQTCKYRGASFLKFLLSREDDVAVFCQVGRTKKRCPRLEIYPKGFPPKYGKRPRAKEGVDGSERSGRVRWKAAILAFLGARPETGAGQREITEYCVELISDRTLVTAANPDDRPRVSKIVFVVHLCHEEGRRGGPTLGQGLPRHRPRFGLVRALSHAGRHLA